MSPRDPQTPLNVLCETRLLDGILESYFIKEILLGSLDRPLRIVPVSDAQAVSPSDNLLVINLFDRSVPLIQKIIAGSQVLCPRQVMRRMLLSFKSGALLGGRHSSSLNRSGLPK
jgi:hypothetical protein